MVISIISNEIYESIYEKHLGGNIIDGDYDEIRFKKENLNVSILRCSNFFIAFMLALSEIISLAFKTKVKSFIQSVDESIASHKNIFDDKQQDEYSSVMFSKNMVYQPNYILFISKMILFVINSPPFYNIVFESTMLGGKFRYTLDGIIMMVTLLRLIFLLNLYFLASKWNCNKFTLILSKSKINLSYLYCLKLEVNYHPMRLCIISIVFMFFS